LIRRKKMFAKNPRAVTRTAARLVGGLSRRLLGLELEEFFALGCGAISELAPGRRGVALTFDDGPSSHSTGRILNILDRNGVRATFFLVGANAARCPTLVRDIVAGGHQIGCHGHRHIDFRHQWPWVIRDDLRICKETLEDIAGVGVDMARPPFLRFRWDLKAIASNVGLTHLVSCNIMPPWDATDPETIINHVCDRIAPRAIVILHDSTGLEEFDVGGLNNVIVNALGPLLAALAARGLPVELIGCE
jgi:peptidoglycan/xylan/chitin deacetylase (PgdA/CDA1 family)